MPQINLKLIQSEQTRSEGHSYPNTYIQEEGTAKMAVGYN